MPDTFVLRNALGAAERFVAGFEGDEMQDGIDGLLAQIRGALNETSLDRGAWQRCVADQISYEEQCAWVGINPATAAT